MTNLITYHVVFGHFHSASDYPNTTIGRTALGDPSFVTLEGNKNQVLAWARREDGQVHVLNQGSVKLYLDFYFLFNVFTNSPAKDPRVVQLTSYQNLDIFVINGLLLYPGNITTTFQSNSELSSLANFSQNSEVPIWDTGSNTTQQVSITQVLSGVRGLTLFAPHNNATEHISGNITQLWNVLRNHMINGTTVYSPSFVNSTYVSAAGENIHLTSNASGNFVMSGNTTARIVQPDVLTENGVIHIIDRVLMNSDVNQTAADDAYSSASSLAAHSPTETGPVGVPTMGMSNNTV